MHINYQKTEYYWKMSDKITLQNKIYLEIKAKEKKISSKSNTRNENKKHGSKHHIFSCFHTFSASYNAQELLICK